MDRPGERAKFKCERLEARVLLTTHVDLSVDTSPQGIVLRYGAFDLPSSVDVTKISLEVMAGELPQSVQLDDAYISEEERSVYVFLPRERPALPSGMLKVHVREDAVTPPTPGAGDRTVYFGHHAADFNQDGSVDTADQAVIESFYGKTGLLWREGDATLDGAVNDADLEVLAESFGTQVPTVLGTPNTLSVGNATTTTLDLLWCPPAEPVASYKVWRSMSGPNDGFAQVATVAGTARSWQDTTLIPGRKAWYRVQAFRVDGTALPAMNKDWGVTPFQAPADASFIRGTSTAPDGSPQQTSSLSWQPTGDATSTTVVYGRLTDGNLQWATVGQVGGSTGQFTHTYPTSVSSSGTVRKYEYTVKVRNAHATSAPTATVDADYDPNGMPVPDDMTRTVYGVFGVEGEDTWTVEIDGITYHHPASGLSRGLPEQAGGTGLWPLRMTAGRNVPMALRKTQENPDFANGFVHNEYYKLVHAQTGMGSHLDDYNRIYDFAIRQTMPAAFSNSNSSTLLGGQDTGDSAGYFHFPQIDVDVDSDWDGVVAANGTADGVQEDHFESSRGVLLPRLSNAYSDLNANEVDDVMDFSDVAGPLVQRLLPLRLSLSPNAMVTPQQRVTFSNPSKFADANNPLSWYGKARLWKKHPVENVPGRIASRDLVSGITSLGELGLVPGGSVTLWLENYVVTSATPALTVTVDQHAPFFDYAVATIQPSYTQNTLRFSDSVKLVHSPAAVSEGDVMVGGTRLFGGILPTYFGRETPRGAYVVPVNNDDVDQDGLPDVVEGAGLLQSAEDDKKPHGSTAAEFKIYTQPDARMAGAKWSFEYGNYADPQQMSADVSVTETLAAQDMLTGSFELGDGLIRLWKWTHDGGQWSGEIVPPGTQMDYALNPTAVDGAMSTRFTIEAVNPSSTPVPLTVKLTTPKGLARVEMVMYVLPFEPSTGIAVDLADYNVIRADDEPGSDPILGTAGHDLIIGSLDDETIDAGYGHDLIVPVGGNDTVLSGNGTDHVLLWSGNNEIIDPSHVTVAYIGARTSTASLSEVTYGASGSPIDGQPDAQDSGNAVRAFTGQDIVAAYKWAYGVDDLWYKAFEEAGGDVLAVDDADTWFFSKWNVDWVQSGVFGPYVGLNVKIQYNIGTVLDAAQALRTAILEYGPKWSNFRDEMTMMYADPRIDAQTFDNLTYTWQEMRQRQIDYVVTTTQLVAELYVEGMLLAAGPGTDITEVVVAAVNFKETATVTAEVVQSVFKMVRLLPGKLASWTHTPKEADGYLLDELPEDWDQPSGGSDHTPPGENNPAAGRRALVNARQYGKYDVRQGDVIHPVIETPSQSIILPVGFVGRDDPNFDIVPYTSTSGGRTTLLVGTAQDTQNSSGAHAARVLSEAKKLVDNAPANRRYLYICMNRTLRTAVANGLGTTAGGRIFPAVGKGVRPDILAVYIDLNDAVPKPYVHLVEVRSPTQMTQTPYERMRNAARRHIQMLRGEGFIKQGLTDDDCIRFEDM